AIGDMLAQKLSLPLDSEGAGREFRKLAEGLKVANPVMLDRIKLGLDRWQKLEPEERNEALVEALKKKGENEERIKRVFDDVGKPFPNPDLEALDAKPQFYWNILDRETAGVHGEALKARMYALMREGYEEKYGKGEIDYEKGWDLRETVRGLSDKEAGKWAEKTFGIRVPETFVKRVGDSVKELINRAAQENPYLLANLVDNVERQSKILGRDPNEDLKELEENTKWVVSQIPPPGSSPPPPSTGGGESPPPPPSTPPTSPPASPSVEQAPAGAELSPLKSPSPAQQPPSEASKNRKKRKKYDLIELQRMVMEGGGLPE
ncbi:MAG: hypothetical protein KIH01_08920, partial [Candidatus Freyarchaeota archaeon]|nr:hypothetical protein [Candidatus Jordarchaeia archaeon]